MQNQHEENPQPSSPKSLSQILEGLPFAQSLVSNLTEQAENSSTTGKGVARREPTGKPPTEIVLGSLRTIAKNALAGTLVDDKQLAGLLTQHFGSERFEAKEKLKHKYGEGGYECESRGFELSLDCLHDNEMGLFDAVDYLNKPAAPTVVAKLVARMRSVLARRNDNSEDMVLLIDTYADHLERYPPDVVYKVVDDIIATRTWFPKIAELKNEMDKMVRFRRAVLELFLRKRGESQARLLSAG